MTVKPPLPRKSKPKATILHLVPIKNKPLDADCSEVVRKLTKALTTAQSGTTVGTLVITIDKDGYWNTQLAGEMMYDKEIISQIAECLLGVCSAPE